MISLKVASLLVQVPGRANYVLSIYSLTFLARKVLFDMDT
jgi:hypothetical protein